MIVSRLDGRKRKNPWSRFTNDNAPVNKRFRGENVDEGMLGWS